VVTVLLVFTGLAAVSGLSSVAAGHSWRLTVLVVGVFLVGGVLLASGLWLGDHFDARKRWTDTAAGRTNDRARL
jgi:hypothetical protein